MSERMRSPFSVAELTQYGAYFKFVTPTIVSKFFPLSPSVAPTVTTFENVASRIAVNPQVSANQTKIIYILSDASFRRNLWIYDITTMAKTQLTTAVSAATQILSATWHPDSTKIVFNGANGNTIETINTDGTGRITLVSGLGTTIYAYPKYNFDGTKIAYFRRNAISSGRDLYVMNADGSGDTNIKTDACDSNTLLNFAWANLSNTIAFVNQGNSVVNLKNLRKINSDGTGETPLTVGANQWGHSLGSKAWLLDDSALMFTRVASSRDQIYKVLSDGSLTATPVSPSVYGITSIGSGFPEVFSDNRVYFSKYDNSAGDKFSMVSILPDGTDQQEIESFVSTDVYGIEFG